MSRLKQYFYKQISDEISSFARYYDVLYQCYPKNLEKRLLFNLIDSPNKVFVENIDLMPSFAENIDERQLVLINGTFNHHLDIQKLLEDIKKKLSINSRLVAVLYNPYFAWIYKLANAFGLRSGEIDITFITKTDLVNFAKIANYEIVRDRPKVYCPWKFLGLGNIINFLLPIIPGLNLFSFVRIVVLRPVFEAPHRQLSLSIIIPARNEEGNIEHCLKLIPASKYKTEVIFVEGNSKDNTWVEIQRVIPHFRDKFWKIKALKQNGKGKNDAVRLGFAEAEGDLLTILDADLTVHPDYLERFYNAFSQGAGQFINGSRLLYPMEGQAMRFLNRLGNIFFAKALSYVLDCSIGDSLCGTKLLSKNDYQRFVAWRKDFGDFDPFGDFELIFPAAILCLGVVDIPIRYGARTYGTTNISRFRHGLMLLQMTLTGLFRVKIGLFSSK